MKLGLVGDITHKHIHRTSTWETLTFLCQGTACSANASGDGSHPATEVSTRTNKKVSSTRHVATQEDNAPSGCVRAAHATLERHLRILERKQDYISHLVQTPSCSRTPIMSCQDGPAQDQAHKTTVGSQRRPWRQDLLQSPLVVSWPSSTGGVNSAPLI